MQRAVPLSADRHEANGLEPGTAHRQTGLMLITPRPGTDRRSLRTMLDQAHTAVSNLAGGGGNAQNAQDRVAAYLEWVNNTARQLGNQLSATDFDRLVLTRGYDRLLATAGTMTGTDIGTQRVLNGMVSLELSQRAEALSAVVEALQAQIERWSIPGRFVVADTSFYIEHENKLEEAGVV